MPHLKNFEFWGPCIIYLIILSLPHHPTQLNPVVKLIGSCGLLRLVSHSGGRRCLATALKLLCACFAGSFLKEDTPLPWDLFLILQFYFQNIIILNSSCKSRGNILMVVGSGMLPLLLSLTTAFCSEWSRNPEPLFASSSVTQKKKTFLHSFQSNIVILEFLN